MNTFFKELITSRSPQGGISHTSFWSNIGMLVMTIIFLYYGFQLLIPEWMMWVYASVVAAPQLISKLISLKWGVSFEEHNKQTSNKDNK